MTSWRLQAIPYAGAMLVVPLFMAISQFAEDPAVAGAVVTGAGAQRVEGSMEVTAFQARQINASSPLAFVDVAPAKPFNFLAMGDQLSRTRAIDCLTAAIYYEAANESSAGQRAVAQVVLNRTRHPAYPSTVCGVVYQGSDRLTGCQFTFTCDGSLMRKPSDAGWRRAQAVANSALSGAVYEGVGFSTNYHADYVVPYWSSTLDRVAKIGAHIFYQMKGGNGQVSAFSQSYSATEPEITPRLQSSKRESPLEFALADTRTLAGFGDGDGQGRVAEEDAEEVDSFGLLEFRERSVAAIGMQDKVGSLEGQLILANRNSSE